MPLTELPALLRDEPALIDVLGRANVVLSVADAARALVIAGLVGRSSRRPFVVAVATSIEAERLAQDLTVLLGGDRVELFPTWETLPFERVSPTAETMGRRLEVLWRLRGLEYGDPERAPDVVVAPIRALTQRLGPWTDEHAPFEIRQGATIDREELAAHLARVGYRREAQVEHRGQFAVRGSIIDVFPSTAEFPVRIDLWDDEVDRLTRFSVSDQRSAEDLGEIRVFGCRELIPTDAVKDRAEKLIAIEPWGREQWERLAEGLVFEGMESWLPWLIEDDVVLADLLDERAQLVLCEPKRLRDHAADLLAEEDDLARVLARTWGTGTAATDDVDPEAGFAEPTTFPRLHVDFDRVLGSSMAPLLNLVAVSDGPDTPRVASVGWNPAVGDGAGLVRQITHLVAEGYRLVVVSDTEASRARVQRLLGDHGVDTVVQVGPLERGCVLSDVRLAVLTESDLTGRRRAHRPIRTRTREAQRYFEDVKPGDYVVHHQHGVARYGGMITRTIGGVERDYLRLDYRGDDQLFVPSDQIDAVRPYSGGDSPKLSKLGGGDFQRTKAGVRADVDKIAQELVVLYQRRRAARGFAFGPDTPWQRELEDSFEYVETPDQLTAIADVKADMEAEAPMDRLVCGDVGFGKTEIAIRAAFKALQDGKQVAVLVPTTLLAQQHFATFSDRFAGFPVRVEVLSRFLTNAQAREVIKGLASGEVDCVIGTHRLLSNGVTFKDLGLLIVDEEQRFGVTHKEAIKALQADVDALTLTATPIPRTLEMSLTGIRDLSLLNTPPADRQPILTYVGEYDERAVAESIRRELLREGQVFFVHNRVRDIDQTAMRLREMVPEARIAIAHGQMDEGTLEQVVLDFWDEQFDVLVCTTIIESGIDMPTVNTLVVDRADLLGLGQLHQLRGRVGRADQRAYAYLFTPPDRVLTEDAFARLRTIGEATELGSGFRIAMRDLEIRGAGNLLGTGQSGHVSAVGYDLYCQMVNEAVAELKGEPVREPAEIRLDLPVDAHLPDDYVSREDLRLEAYRHLAEVTTDDAVENIRTEWLDRYGPVPEPAEALLAVARLRAECVRLGITEVAIAKGPGFGGPAYVAKVSPVELRTSQVMRLKRLVKGAIYKEALGQLVLPLPKTQELAHTLTATLRDLVPPT